jgi:hypothetical protein
MDKVIKAIEELKKEMKEQKSEMNKQQLKLEWTCMFIDGLTTHENLKFILEKLK